MAKEQSRVLQEKLEIASRAYGVSIERYEEMLNEQEPVCAICKRPSTTLYSNNSDTVRALAIDHDHKTGQVRGLLCGSCNRALGAFEDDIERLEAAIGYLKKSRVELGV